jgi:GntR family transcriptional regulator, carbon starvation induced regulator
MIDYYCADVGGVIYRKRCRFGGGPIEEDHGVSSGNDSSRTRIDVPEVPKLTLASAMYAQLRDEILTGAVLPGAKLNIRELGDRFSAGLSPAREALSRLSAEGLVQQEDNRGFSVAPVSVSELHDLTKARCWVNEIGLRQSIANGGANWEEALVLAFHRLSRTPRHLDASSDRSPAWEYAHRMFHRALIDGCGSRWLVETCERYFEAAERYRLLARAAGIQRSKAEDEHRQIMQAAVDRKVSEAVELLNTHFLRTAELVQKALADGLHPTVSRSPRNVVRIKRER